MAGLAAVLNRSVKNAQRLYESFRESPAKRARVVRVTLPKAAAVIGKVRAIEYDTTHGGRATLYRHDFSPGSGPLLVAGTKTGQLYLIEGRYHVTERGIVDLDAQGNEIDDGGGHRRRRR